MPGGENNRVAAATLECTHLLQLLVTYVVTGIAWSAAFCSALRGSTKRRCISVLCGNERPPAASDAGRRAK